MVAATTTRAPQGASAPHPPPNPPTAAAAASAAAAAAIAGSTAAAGRPAGLAVEAAARVQIGAKERLRVLDWQQKGATAERAQLCR